MQCNSSNELHAVHHVGEMRLTFVVQNCMGTQILPNPNPAPQKLISTIFRTIAAICGKVRLISVTLEASTHLSACCLHLQSQVTSYFLVIVVFTSYFCYFF